MNSFDKWRGNPPTSGYNRDIQSWHTETERLRKCWDEAQADLRKQVERLTEKNEELLTEIEMYIKFIFEELIQHSDDLADSTYGEECRREQDYCTQCGNILDGYEKA